MLYFFNVYLPTFKCTDIEWCVSRKFTMSYICMSIYDNIRICVCAQKTLVTRSCIKHGLCRYLLDNNSTKLCAVSIPFTALSCWYQHRINPLWWSVHLLITWYLFTFRIQGGAVKTRPFSHKINPIARPLGRGMGCTLWGQTRIYTLLQSLQ